MLSLCVEFTLSIFNVNPDKAACLLDSAPSFRTFTRPINPPAVAPFSISSPSITTSFTENVVADTLP